MKIVGVIPAYNEAATIRDVATRALRFLPNLIVVNDGSSDGTLQELGGLPVTRRTWARARASRAASPSRSPKAPTRSSRSTPTRSTARRTFRA